MNKQSLTIAEKIELEKELTSQGVTIAQIIPEVPTGIYSGKFDTQKLTDKTLQPVIVCVEYNRNDKPMAFFAVKASMANDAKAYNGINVGLTDELETKLSDPTNLVKDYAFRSKQGRVRTFVSVED